METSGNISTPCPAGFRGLRGAQYDTRYDDNRLRNTKLQGVPCEPRSKTYYFLRELSAERPSTQVIQW